MFKNAKQRTNYRWVIAWTVVRQHFSRYWIHAIRKQCHDLPGFFGVQVA